MKVKQYIYNLIKYLIGLTGPKTAVRIRYFHIFKKFPDLVHPKTFNEKINAYKFDTRYDFHLYADKVTVKDYVAAKIGVEHVIPTLYAGQTLPSVAERTWEMPYVIKLNNGSATNIFVRNQKERDWKIIDKKITTWNKGVFGSDTGEIHYSKIKPLILVEKFLIEKNHSVPLDYKIFVFNGKAEFVQLSVDRELNYRESYYDTNWNLLPFSNGTPVIFDSKIEKPKNLETMLSYAEKLSANFPFVRVDFYNIEEKIYFGEMTFTPSAGLAKFYPNSYDLMYGNKLDLN